MIGSSYQMGPQITNKNRSICAFVTSLGDDINPNLLQLLKYSFPLQYHNSLHLIPQAIPPQPRLQQPLNPFILHILSTFTPNPKMVKPTTCCGRADSCVCQSKATCSCGKQHAMNCTCEKKAQENSISGARCSCRKSFMSSPSLSLITWS
jgi:hypothetical protein